MIDYESLPLLGSPFEHVETYVYYEGRRTFALRSTWADLYYIVNTVDEDEEADTLTTLCVALSGDRFRSVRSGIVGFREAFTESASQALHAVTWHFAEDPQAPTASIKPVSRGDLPEAWLPYPDTRLNLPSETEIPFRDADVGRLALSQSRTVFAIEVGGTGGNITQLPVRTTGELQVALGAEIDALYSQVAKVGFARDVVPMFLGVRAASFVLVMAIESPGLVEIADVTQTVFENFEALIYATASEQRGALLGEMKKHNPRVRNRFKDILKPLSMIDSGIALITSVARSGEVSRVAATAVQVRAAYSEIENSPPGIEHVDIARGALIGLNVRTRSFEINDLASVATYKGHMDQDVQDLARQGFVVGESGLVSARIRMEIPFATGSGESGTHYFLEKLEALDEHPKPDGTAPGI
jgi:hypothetical protein